MIVLMQAQTVLQIIGVAVFVLITAIFFSSDTFVPDKKPDKETMGVIAFIFGLIVFIIVGAVIWEKIS